MPGKNKYLFWFWNQRSELQCQQWICAGIAHRNYFVLNIAIKASVRLTCQKTLSKMRWRKRTSEQNQNTRMFWELLCVQIFSGVHNLGTLLISLLLIDRYCLTCLDLTKFCPKVARSTEFSCGVVTQAKPEKELFNCHLYNKATVTCQCLTSSY